MDNLKKDPWETMYPSPKPAAADEKPIASQKERERFVEALQRLIGERGAADWDKHADREVTKFLNEVGVSDHTPPDPEQQADAFAEQARKLMGVREAPSACYTLKPNGQTVRVKPSEIHGLGVFAVSEFLPGHLIGLYEGEVSYKLLDPYCLWLEDERGTTYGIVGSGPLKYLNHSSEPNAETDGAHIYAINQINHGDEITIAYDEEEPEFDDDDNPDGE